MTVAVRPESAEDQQTIWHVNQAAFEGDAEANLVDALRDGGFVDVATSTVKMAASSCNRFSIHYVRCSQPSPQRRARRTQREMQ